MTDFETTAHDSPEELAGPKVIGTRKAGVWLLQNPSTNQGTAFDRAQREELRLRGILPYRVTTLEHQATAAIGQIRAKDTPSRSTSDWQACTIITRCSSIACLSITSRS
jgi:hypothetical protein